MAQSIMSAVNGNVGFTIPHISKLKGFWTQEFIVDDIPWYVNVKKELDQGKSYLGAHLDCSKKSKTPNWSQPARFTIKILSVKDDVATLVHHIHPFIYDHTKKKFGDDAIISWDDLFDASKGYVKNDTIKMEFLVEVADQNPNTKSNLILIRTDTCREGDWSKYHLTVTNIENLMAVQLAKIVLRNIPWNLVVFKDQKGHLGIYNDCHIPKHKGTFKRSMSCKILSRFGQAKSIEKVVNRDVGGEDIFSTGGIVSFTDLMNPENGFIQNGEISIEVEIKLVLPTKDENVQAKRPRMECGICKEEMAKKELSSVACGHTFCSACIERTVETNKQCPICKKPANANELRRTLLPM